MALAACGTDGGSFDERAAEIEGIYEVRAYTRNDDACAPGGTSQLGSDTFALVARTSLLGIDYLVVQSCASPADCRDQHAKLAAGALVPLEWQFGLAALGADGALVAEGASSGFSTTEGICRQGEVTATTLTFDGGALRVEQRITPADDYPEDAEGFCTTDAARAAAAGNACVAMEILEAELREPL